jgi:hypothetical protein
MANKNRQRKKKREKKKEEKERKKDHDTLEGVMCEFEVVPFTPRIGKLLR